jgi:branched-chain amino acid transport system ATP-binding protein
MLEIRELVVSYGPVLAVDRVTMTVREQEIVGVLVSPSSGAILFQGRALPKAPHARTALGISIVPEGRGLFPQMSVEENLLMGAYGRRDVARIEAGTERCFSMFPILLERRRQTAGTLSGGQQQMLAVSVGLMSDPVLLVLDEPTLGLAPIVIGEALRQFREMRLTVLLIEQNATLTCSVADRIYVVSGGRIRIEDRADALLKAPELIEELI